jgi:hypothetical protein
MPKMKPKKRPEAMQPGISSCHDDRREGGGQDETDHNRKPRPWQPDRHGRISVKGRMPRIETQMTGFDRAGLRWDRLRPAGGEKYKLEDLRLLRWKSTLVLYYRFALSCIAHNELRRPLPWVAGDWKYHGR